MHFRRYKGYRKMTRQALTDRLWTQLQATAMRDKARMHGFAA